jgi:hypothetical protein
MSTTETSEREAFEAWYSGGYPVPPKATWFNRDPDEPEDYAGVDMHWLWKCWKARAALASQPVTQSVEPVAKECRHCGWMCAPNNAPTRRWYPLAAPQPSVSQERQEGEE